MSGYSRPWTSPRLKAENDVHKAISCMCANESAGPSSLTHPLPHWIRSFHTDVGSLASLSHLLFLSWAFLLSLSCRAHHKVDGTGKKCLDLVLETGWDGWDVFCVGRRGLRSPAYSCRALKTDWWRYCSLATGRSGCRVEGEGRRGRRSVILPLLECGMSRASRM